MSENSHRDFKYQNTGQQRALKLVLLLSRRVVSGMKPLEISEFLNASPSVVTRDLANLRLAGFAEQIEATGHWRLSPRVAQIGMDVLADMDRAQRQVDETRNRFTRTQQ